MLANRFLQPITNVRTVTTKRIQLITLHNTNMRNGPKINVDLQATASQIEVMRPKTVDPASRLDYMYPDALRCSGLKVNMEVKSPVR